MAAVKHRSKGVPPNENPTATATEATPTETPPSAEQPASESPSPEDVAVVADEPSEAASETVAPEPPATSGTPTYRVAPGRSLTTRRGLKDSGEELDPAKDVHGGVARLDELVAAGAVTKS